jgi:hypothetical protein
LSFILGDRNPLIRPDEAVAFGLRGSDESAGEGSQAHPPSLHALSLGPVRLRAGRHNAGG